MIPLHVTGIIIHTTGTVLIGIAALAVHRDVVKEHRIDDEVVQTMKMEAKNTAPNTAPAGMRPNTSGITSNIKGGPLLSGIPKTKALGTTIRPAMTAAATSIPAVITAVRGKFVLLRM